MLYQRSLQLVRDLGFLRTQVSQERNWPLKLSDAWLLNLVRDDGREPLGRRYGRERICDNCDQPLFSVLDKKGIECTSESEFCPTCRHTHGVVECPRCASEHPAPSDDTGSDLCSGCEAALFSDDD